MPSPKPGERKRGPYKVWSADIVRKEVLKMAQENGDRVPAYCRKGDAGYITGALRFQISKYFGTIQELARELGLPYGPNRWSREKTLRVIRERQTRLGSDEMPTLREIQSTGYLSLAKAMQLHGVASLSKELGLEMKDSQYNQGSLGEDKAAKILERLGLSPVRQRTTAPYDIDVGGVHVDVKTAYVNEQHGGVSFTLTSWAQGGVHTDFFMCLAFVRGKKEPKHVFYVPTFALGEGKRHLYVSLKERCRSANKYAQYKDAPGALLLTVVALSNAKEKLKMNATKKAKKAKLWLRSSLSPSTTRRNTGWLGRTRLTPTCWPCGASFRRVTFSEKRLT